MTRKGIINFLREKEGVIDLEDEISIPDFRYSKDLKNRDIGIKSLPFFKNFIKIRRIALIKMVLKIEKRLLDRWENNGRGGMVLHKLNIQNDIKRFFDQIEQFILRGTDTKTAFAVNDIGEDEVFNCFFLGQNNENPINIYEFRDLHEAVSNLKHKLRNYGYNSPFTILSDSETLKWAKYQYFHVGDKRETYKDRVLKLNKCDNWLELNGNADNSKGDDYKLVCFAHNRYFEKAIKIIEKSPINMFNCRGGIVLYWCGALEISDNAIQIVRIEHLEKSK